MMHLTKMKAAAIVLTAAAAAGAVAIGTGAWATETASASQGAARSAPAQTRPTQPQEAQSRGDPRFSVANNPPVVVATWPRSGETAVDPALEEIRVTFSKAMNPENFSFARVSEDSFPTTTGQPRYDAQRQTFILPVELKPSHSYVIRLNFPPDDSFMDEGGRKAIPFLLVFETAESSERAVQQRLAAPATNPDRTEPMSAVRKVDENDPVFQRARPFRDALFALISQADKAEAWPANLEAARAAGLDTSKLPDTVRYARPKEGVEAAQMPVLFETLQFPAEAEREARRGVWVGFADGRVQLFSDPERFAKLRETAGL